MSQREQFLKVLNIFLSKTEKELNQFKNSEGLCILDGVTAKEQELKAIKLIIQAYKELYPK